MLTNISWGSYLTAISTILIIWYIFLGLRFYSSEIKQILTGKRKIVIPFLRRKNVKNSIYASQVKSTSNSSATLDEVNELSSRLIDAISESVERKRSRQEFQYYLKLILNEYPYVKISSLRSTVNGLIFLESQKNADLILTIQQVEGLWEEII